MALTASYVTAGFEPVYNKIMQQVPNPVAYELAPNTAFAKGDLVVLSAGKVVKAAASATNVLGAMAAAYTTVTNPTGEMTVGMVYDQPFNVYRVTFAGHRDGTATGGTTTTLVDTGLTTSTDNVWNGALLYVYEGPGAGSIRTVKTYTGASDTLTVEKAFPTAITTASKYILLGAAAAAGDVINVGSVGVNISSASTVNAAATVVAEAGPLAVLAIDPFALTMDVMVRKHLFNTP